MAVLEYERLKKNVQTPPATHTENKIDDILADDFESDMPFETSPTATENTEKTTDDIQSDIEANTDSDKPATEPNNADASIKAKIKKKAERPSYEFKKAQVLDLLNKLKEESETEK